MFLRTSPSPSQTISRFLELEFWKPHSHSWYYHFHSTAACPLSSTVLLANTVVSWMASLGFQPVRFFIYKDSIFFYLTFELLIILQGVSYM